MKLVFIFATMYTQIDFANDQRLGHSGLDC